MILTMNEKNRIEAVQGVMDGKIGINEAGKVLDRSVRQVFRMLKSLREEGLEGLIHKNKGKKSSRKIKKAIRKRIVELARGKFSDINDTHLKEILLREEKIKIGRETLRTILRGENISPKLKRRSVKHRSRRERKEAFGVMLQIDGSPHDWLEGRGPRLTLIGAKDDATSFVWARFEEAETTWGYLSLMRDIFTSKGLPLSLYSDRHTIFHSPKEPTIVEQINNIRPMTQFGRAMKELGITIIKAWSAPAKGRIENQWKTFQDRLVVELRLAGVKSREGANQFLEQFLKDYNQRFCVVAKKREPVFRQSPSPSNLDRVLCLKETRTVAKDHTISFEGLVLQIPPSRKFYSIARQKVQVLQLKDGSVEVVYKEQLVARFCPEAVRRLVEKNYNEKHQPNIAA
ncbi:MAG: ISNCY family transposase [Desulfomonile sp.]